MPEKHTARRFSEYNRILKETDELYRSAVKTMGLPDCAFWILYTLRESSETPDAKRRLLYPVPAEANG